MPNRDWLQNWDSTATDNTPAEASKNEGRKAFVSLA